VQSSAPVSSGPVQFISSPQYKATQFESRSSQLEIFWNFDDALRKKITRTNEVKNISLTKLGTEWANNNHFVTEHRDLNYSLDDGWSIRGK
jgi:hypothetical protein